MSYLIKKWYLPYEQEKEPTHDFNLKPCENWLEHLSKVTILIGPNNSGKSRFLRHLFQLKYELLAPTSFDLEYLIKLISEIKEIISAHYNQKGIPDIDQIYRDIFLEKLTPSNYIVSNKANPIDINTIMKGIRDFTAGNIKVYSNVYTPQTLANLSVPIIDRVSTIADQIDEIKSNFRKLFEFHKIYIPTLRGLRPYKNLVDCYKDRTKDDYFKDNPFQDKEIFTGLDMYKKVDDLYKGNLQERSLLEKYEKFISNHFFESKEFKLYPRRESDVLFVKLGIEDEFPIHKLGDGIQHLIIITFPLFVNKDKDVLVFIEEPELYLHPGLQRKLLELLTSNELGSTQSFLTTHSNHFLDM